MTTLYITRGLPASGKSTYARTLVAGRPSGTLVRVNRDDLRVMVAGENYGAPVPDVEKVVTMIAHKAMHEALRKGLDVICDDTNLPQKRVRELAGIAHKYGAAVEVLDFTNVPMDTCIMRDKVRDRMVGEDVIRGMHERYLKGKSYPLPLPEVAPAAVVGKPYTGTPGAPRAVMVDIDGTVALHEGVRSPYDATKYHLDRPNEHVISIVNSLECMGWSIVFCSGRDEDYREATEAWLNEHLDFDDMGAELHMRPSGDTRNDAIVKIELFDRHIRDRYDVRMVFDDRQRVVDAWRSIGLTVAQIAPGDF